LIAFGRSLQCILSLYRHVEDKSSSKYSTTKTCEFVHGGVDLNALIFRVAALRVSNARFARLHTPCATLNLSRGCRGVDGRPWWVADWGFVHQVLSSGGTRACVDTRPLLVQN